LANQSCIYWFSGTGNSFYAAKKLSAYLDIPVTRITAGTPARAIGGKGEKVGFVFPSYYGNLPRAVRAFVSRLEILQGTYLFAIVTMGAVGQGSVGAMDKAMKEKGLTLHYGRGVLAPANYVLSYNPADSDSSESKLNKVDDKIRKIAGDIKAGKNSIRSLPVTADNLYKDVSNLDAGFTVSGDCTGCALCERLCPVGNIRLEKGAPMWQRHCEHCVACISWCPAKAIEYGDITRNRRRYRNPRVNVKEMLRVGQ